jgi:hypothetical protein
VSAHAAIRKGLIIGRCLSKEQGRIEDLAVLPLVSVGRFADLEELVGDAGLSQQSRDLIVQVNGPRLGVGLRPALEPALRCAAEMGVRRDERRWTSTKPPP